ncbi:hypothetical protein Cgig2_000839 [Carnegiea gigantea]|uniref:DUF4283 domain-containing protein n=1 Tax=Carnegiea gigantea TaxID=171969 RepID=A0A9Q1JK87_9CARY|nr:hypothetical protein Cgig2_000839 [Carnegiea gigantea]
MVSSYAALVNPDEGTTLNFMQAPVINGSTYAKIEKEDVLPEIDYWQTAVLCSVLGANPPIEVRLLDLDIKFWGMASLSKLGSTLGIPIKTDRHTMDKTRLSCARLLIDIPVDGLFPEYLDFVNDHDVVVRLRVEYEWKPLKCNHCKIFGHNEEECRKKAKSMRVCREVQTHSVAPREKGSSQPQGEEMQVERQQVRPDTEGFITVRRPARRRSPIPAKKSENMKVQNSFELLQNTQGDTSNSNPREPPHG